MNKQNRNRLIDTEKRLMVATGEGIGGQGKRGEGTEKYRLVASYKVVTGM